MKKVFYLHEKAENLFHKFIGMKIWKLTPIIMVVQQKVIYRFPKFHRNWY